MGIVIYSVGHSTRTLADFLSLVHAYGIEAVADVRAFPSSRKYPHFSQKPLEATLAQARIQYVWLGEELGGYRRFGLGELSPNTAWDTEGFRNYADHMLSPKFARGIGKLLALTGEKRTAYMCAERSWWRCHRRLISDWLVAHGHRVIHIFEPGNAMEHRLPLFARVVGGNVIYPGEPLPTLRPCLTRAQRW